MYYNPSFIGKEWLKKHFEYSAISNLYFKNRNCHGHTRTCEFYYSSVPGVNYEPIFSSNTGF